MAAAQHIPGKRLDSIGFFSRKRTRYNEAGIGPCLLEPARSHFQSIVPRSGHEFIALLNHRRANAVRGMERIKAEPAYSANISVVLLGVYFHDFTVLAARYDTASGSTSGANRIMLLEVPFPAVLPAIVFHDCVHGAGVHAGAAESTARFMKGLVHCRGNFSGNTAAHKIEYIGALLLTDPYATAAKDAIIVVDGDKGTAVVQLVIKALPPKRRFADAEVRCIPLKVAAARLGAGHAVKR